MIEQLQASWLGRIGYAEALERQEELVRRKRANDSLGDQLFLLEHEPVYTIGRTSDRSSLRGGSHLPYASLYETAPPPIEPAKRESPTTATGRVRPSTTKVIPPTE